MNRILTLFAAATVYTVAGTGASAQIRGQQMDDWGDAPECFAAYPSGVIGHFPTCSNACQPGTQELDASRVVSG